MNNNSKGNTRQQPGRPISQPQQPMMPMQPMMPGQPRNPCWYPIAVPPWAPQPIQQPGVPTPTQPGIPVERPAIEIPARPGPPVMVDTRYLQGYLRENIGRYVRIDFLIGTNLLIDKAGELIDVGIDYVVLRETETDDHDICDLYSIKFVKIFY